MKAEYHFISQRFSFSTSMSMWRSPKINLHQNWSIAPSPWCSASFQHSLCQSGTIVMGPYKPSAMMLRYHKLRWIRFKSHRPFWFKKHLTKKTHDVCHQILLASCFRYHQSGFFVSFERLNQTVCRFVVASHIERSRLLPFLQKNVSPIINHLKKNT